MTLWSSQIKSCDETQANHIHQIPVMEEAQIANIGKSK